MERDLKMEVIVATIHGTGVEIDNMLETSDRMEHQYSGAVKAIDDVTSDIKSMELPDDVKSKVLAVISSKRDTYNFNRIQQRGVTKGLKDVIQFLKHRMDEARMKAANPNIGRRPEKDEGGRRKGKRAEKRKE